MYLPPPSSLPVNSIVDCYVRDSGGPRQDASTDQQLTELEAYCQQHNLTLRHKFIDIAKSGGSTIARDEFNRLIDSTRRPEDRPAAILLWNYARFARDLDDAIYYKALLRNRNIIVHSLTDPIPEGQYGRIIEFFIDISNEEKRRQTSTDAKRGLRDLVLKHGCVPGIPPKGFLRQPVTLGLRRDGTPKTVHRWRPDPDLVPLVRQAFQMRAEGKTLSQIHTTTRLFGAINSYKTFFSNRLYIGILEYGGEVIEHYCDPLIDLPTWNAVQTRIEQHSQFKRDRMHPRRVHTPYILSGLVYCGECGSIMSSNTVTGGQRGRNEAYRCSRSKRKAGCTQGRIGRKTLEDAVLYTLNEYILLPDALAAAYTVELESIQHRETRRAERLATLSAERKRLSSQIANLTRAIAEKGHSPALLERLTQLEAQRATSQVEITELQNQVFPSPPELTQGEITATSQTLRDAITNAPPEQVRLHLQGFIHEIRIKKDGQGQLVGTITYFTPDLSPPFDLPQSEHSGYNLPISPAPLGAPLYRQTFAHPIIKRPRP